jgi:Succinylglutamate desuccinylase / Aspartoacylase family
LNATTPTSTAALARDRIIGRIRAEAPGPTLVVVGSIHGNEPAGTEALEAVVEKLTRESLLKRGDFLAVVGNIGALEKGARYIDEDLNRRWSPEAIDRLRSGGAVEASEDRERKELDFELEKGFASARGPVVLLDLHTTSGDGKPFSVFADTLRSRRFARRFPVPAILGLEENLDNTLADYVALLGHVAVAFEGGQHRHPDSVSNLAAVVWVALAELLMVDPEGVGVEGERAHLRRATEGVPSILEVTYRHVIVPRDRFQMRPGFRSFERVVSGQVIARDVEGSVAVPSDGFLLMPLYQKLGDDGFFVARRVRSFWLALSAALRTLRAGRIAHWLPGVSRLKGDPHALTVNRRVARWYSLPILHLLGLRLRSEEGDRLTVERRAHDLP